MAFSHKLGYHTGPRKPGLVSEPHAYIWKTYWEYRHRNKKPHHKTIEFKYYEEAHRRLYEHRYTSNKSK